MELLIAMGAIQCIKDDCDYDEVQEILNTHLSEEDRKIVDDYVETVDFTSEDVLMAAIAVVKKKINELKETKE